MATYRQALDIARETGNWAVEGQSRHNIGAGRARGHFAEASEMYQQALAIAREVDDRAGAWVTLDHIGRVYNNQGRYIEALQVN